MMLGLDAAYIATPDTELPLGSEAVARLRSQCSYPWWCSVIGGFFEEPGEACFPFTPKELRACQQFGPAMPPEKAEESRREADVAVAAYCDLHPEECAGYLRTIAKCSWYETIDEDEVSLGGDAICKPNLVLLAGLGAGFIGLLMVLRR